MEPPPPLVEIHWLDAWASTDCWTESKDVEHGPKRVCSVGYLLKSDEKGFTIAQSVSEEQVDQCLFVPAACVESFHFCRVATQPEGVASVG